MALSVRNSRRPRFLGLALLALVAIVAVLVLGLRWSGAELIAPLAGPIAENAATQPLRGPLSTARNEIPRLHVSSTEAALQQLEPSVCVQVVDLQHAPIAGAAVTISYKGLDGHEAEAVTSPGGIATFDGSQENSIALLEVHAQGFASISLAKPTPAESGASFRRFLVTMRPGAAIEARVTDSLDARVGRHMIIANYVGVQLDPTARDGNILAGTVRTRIGVTDELGVLQFEALEPGWWDLHCERWRSRARSEHVLVLAQPDSLGRGTLYAEAIPQGLFASGRISGLEDQHSTELGTIDSYWLDRSGGGSLTSWLYDGGQFFVFGQTGEEALAVLVDSQGNRKSLPFELRIGDHDVVIDPVWP